MRIRGERRIQRAVWAGRRWRSRQGQRRVGVDRVVKLSRGGREVRNSGVSWPHHIFVDKSVKVVGANGCRAAYARR
jgi:hypothetical protein